MLPPLHPSKPRDVGTVGRARQQGAGVGLGAFLAYRGNSGCSSGPHPHLERVSVATGNAAFLATCDSVDGETRAVQVTPRDRQSRCASTTVVVCGSELSSVDQR